MTSIKHLCVEKPFIVDCCLNSYFFLEKLKTRGKGTSSLWQFSFTLTTSKKSNSPANFTLKHSQDHTNLIFRYSCSNKNTCSCRAWLWSSSCGKGRQSENKRTQTCTWEDFKVFIWTCLMQWSELAVMRTGRKLYIQFSRIVHRSIIKIYRFSEPVKIWWTWKDIKKNRHTECWFFMEMFTEKVIMQR